MPQDNLNDLIRKGISALEKDNMVMALVHLEAAAEIEETPTVRSCLAYCLAKERRQLQQSASMCMQAMQMEPGNTLHYLNLGRIYLLAGQKVKAIRTFRKGLKLKRDQRIIDELKGLGIRSQPVLSSLDRNHPLNKHLGKLLKKMGMR